MPRVSHFAPWQAPVLFNAVLLQFLDGSKNVEEVINPTRRHATTA